MSQLRLNAFAVILAVLAPACCVFADTVVFDSGRAVEGEAFVGQDSVRIERADGMLTVPLARVELIRRGGLQQPLALRVGRSQEHVSASSGDAGPAVRPGGRAGEMQMAAALEKRISVHFDNASLPEAIAYLREVTAVNFAYRRSELEQAGAPVTMHLEEVRLSQVLELLLEGTGLQWSLRRDVVRITPEAQAQPMDARRYDVRDLLWNTQDVGQSGGQGRRELAPRGQKDESWGQYGYESQDEWGSQGGYGASSGYDGGRGYGPERRGGGRGGRAYAGQPASQRAYDLAELIVTMVEPHSWAEPPVVSVGD